MQRRDDDIQREIRTHIELEAEERAAEGLSETQALHAARRAFGSVARTQEDVRAVGVSSLSGAHMTLFPEIAERLAREAPEVLLFCGGIIPDDDREPLAKCGYKGIFGPGTSTADIIAWLKKELGAHDR